MYQFGDGLMFVAPVGGNEATNPSPSQLLTVQSFKFDVKVTLVPLKGQNQFPDDVAPGDKEGSGSFAIGNNQITQENNILYADALTTGIKQVTQQTAAIPGSPFSITVTNSANFFKDLGVRNSATGAFFQAVASGPTAGQYSVAAGVYTFSTADHTSGVSVIISYAWTDSSVGNTLTVNNQLMGYGPIVEIWFSETYQSVSGNPNGLHLFNCRIGSVKKDIKRDGYLVPEYDFMAYPNSSNQVFEEFQVAN